MSDAPIESTDDPAVEPAQLAPEEQARARRTRRLWIGAAAAAVLAAALAVGVLVSLLFGPGTTKVAKDVLACVSNRDFTKGAKHTCPPKGATRVDGLIETATKSQIDVVTTDGRRFSYVVRPADAPYLDIPHAQQHAALGQPTTIYTRDYKGATVVVYMKDSDLNFQEETS
ncbi:MAG: hypothetical protein JWN72_1376 [Thermoleophilia bacterium]|nr:hypothetical protein [Thermoleophilia bacterium]